MAKMATTFRALSVLSLAVPALAPAAPGHDEPVGPTKPVVIVNTPAQAVPVNGTVTGTVSVGNTPDVRVVNTPTVTVGNTPTVNVGNTPTVNVGTLPGVSVVNTPTVNVGSLPGVSVVNTPAVNARQSGAWSVSLEGQGDVRAAQSGGWTVGIDGLANTVRLDPTVPVPVRNVEAAALEPFQAALARGESVRVPDGRRLVIEFVSVLGEETLGDDPDNDTGFLQPLLITTAGGVFVRHFIALGPPQTFRNDGEVTARYHLASQPVRVYADPGTDVTYGGVCANVCDSRATISGYLVPAS